MSQENDDAEVLPDADNNHEAEGGADEEPSSKKSKAAGKARAAGSASKKGKAPEAQRKPSDYFDKESLAVASAIAEEAPALETDVEKCKALKEMYHGTFYARFDMLEELGYSIVLHKPSYKPNEVEHINLNAKDLKQPHFKSDQQGEYGAYLADATKNRVHYRHHLIVKHAKDGHLRWLVSATKFEPFRALVKGEGAQEMLNESISKNRTTGNEVFVQLPAPSRSGDSTYYGLARSFMHNVKLVQLLQRTDLTSLVPAHALYAHINNLRAGKENRAKISATKQQQQQGRKAGDEDGDQQQDDEEEEATGLNDEEVDNAIEGSFSSVLDVEVLQDNQPIEKLKKAEGVIRDRAAELDKAFAQLPLLQEKGELAAYAESGYGKIIGAIFFNENEETRKAKIVACGKLLAVALKAQPDLSNGLKEGETVTDFLKRQLETARDLLRTEGTAAWRKSKLAGDIDSVFAFIRDEFTPAEKPLLRSAAGPAVMAGAAIALELLRPKIQEMYNKFVEALKNDRETITGSVKVVEGIRAHVRETIVAKVEQAKDKQRKELEAEHAKEMNGAAAEFDKITAELSEVKKERNDLKKRLAAAEKELEELRAAAPKSKPAAKAPAPDEPVKSTAAKPPAPKAAPSKPAAAAAADPAPPTNGKRAAPEPEAPAATKKATPAAAAADKPAAKPPAKSAQEETATAVDDDLGF